PIAVARLTHTVVTYLEHPHSENLSGGLSGPEGLTQAAVRPQQQDLTGTVYTTLPQPMDTRMRPPVPDTRFPNNLPNALFDIAQYIPANQNIPDLVHRYYQEQAQIHAGALDLFPAVRGAAGLAMGYYQTDVLPLKGLAQQYTVCDHFFHGAFGGSFLNHFWLIAAKTPSFPSAPTSMRATVDANGVMITDGAV